MHYFANQFLTNKARCFLLLLAIFAFDGIKGFLGIRIILVSEVSIWVWSIRKSAIDIATVNYLIEGSSVLSRDIRKGVSELSCFSFLASICTSVVSHCSQLGFGECSVWGVFCLGGFWTNAECNLTVDSSWHEVHFLSKCDIGKSQQDLSFKFPEVPSIRENNLSMHYNKCGLIATNMMTKKLSGVPAPLPESLQPKRLKESGPGKEKSLGNDINSVNQVSSACSAGRRGWFAPGVLLESTPTADTTLIGR